MEKSFTIDFIKDEDADDVIAFLRRNFFKDSPLNKCLQIGDNPQLERFYLRMIHLGFSFKAVSSIDNRILGVLINDKMSYNDESISLVDRIEDDRLKTLVIFIETIAGKFDMWSAYPDAKQCLGANTLSVDESARGLGIAKALTERSMEYGRLNGYHLIQMSCSSKFSAMVCERLEMDRLFAIKFDDYKVNGEVVLRPDAPHTENVVYVKKL